MSDRYFRVANWLLNYQVKDYDDPLIHMPWQPQAFLAPTGIADFVCHDFRGLCSINALFQNSRLLFEGKNGVTYYRVCLATDNKMVLLEQTDSGKEPLIVFRTCYPWNEAELVLNKGVSDRMCFEMYGKVFNSAVLFYGGLFLHGALIEYEGKGIAIVAPAGVGKSTHARLWRDYENALIINGDRILLRKCDGVWTAFGSPWCGSSSECIARSVPLSAIVLLQRGTLNEATSVSYEQAFPMLFQSLLLPKWSEELSSAGLDSLNDIAENTPIISLKCSPDQGSIEALKEVLSKCL